MSPTPVIQQLIAGDVKTLARIISLVENEAPGYEALLQQLPVSEIERRDLLARWEPTRTRAQPVRAAPAVAG